MEDGVPEGGVDGGEGVVEQVEGAPLVDGPRQADPLLLTAAQVLPAAVHPRLHVVKNARVAFQFQSLSKA